MVSPNLQLIYSPHHCPLPAGIHVHPGGQDKVLTWTGRRFCPGGLRPADPGRQTLPQVCPPPPFHLHPHHNHHRWGHHHTGRSTDAASGKNLPASTMSLKPEGDQSQRTVTSNVSRTTFLMMGFLLPEARGWARDEINSHISFRNKSASLDRMEFNAILLVRVFSLEIYN